MTGRCVLVHAKGLEVDSVSKWYGPRRALHSISFGVAPGELFGFVGGNGAGKTTTMRIVVGVLESDGGAVRWDGEDATPEIRAGVGYMPEERGLYPKMTVGDHLVYLARLHGLPRQEAVVSMLHWTDRLDVDRYRDKEIETLSLGNRQRVQLAAALVHRPSFLLLDEPFSGLDPLAVDTMSDILREKTAEGVPVLFSSHQLDLVERLCDRVGIVADGALVACGTVDELSADGGTHLYIEVDGASPDWLERVEGIESARPEGAGTAVRLRAGHDENRLVRHALSAGNLRAFHRRRAGLPELFRHYVSAGQESRHDVLSDGQEPGPTPREKVTT
ncbi:ABC transporter ATP-binding protein [Streptomyces sp. NPDC021080]|uniref:ABC transporter ATP-binding protein n=1 Tax=Streptomyces sp. NPDC021080 TaxID=3365110 RepID=UPI0037BD4BE3